MAVRGKFLDKEVVIKESGGKTYISEAVPWAGHPEKRPKEVIDVNEAFKKAVEKCKDKSKFKHGTVWGVSEFNKCIGEEMDRMIVSKMERMKKKGREVI